MGQVGPLQLLIVAVVVLLLFGRGKIPALMSDVAQGIKSFKRGMSDDKVETADAAPTSKTVEHEPIREPVREPTEVKNT